MLILVIPAVQSGKRARNFGKPAWPNFDPSRDITMTADRKLLHLCLAVSFPVI